MRYRTNKDLTIHKGAYTALRGDYVEVPKGSPVEDRRGTHSCFFVSPSVFPTGGIDRHDATHYGFRVSEEDVEEVKE